MVLKVRRNYSMHYAVLQNVTKYLTTRLNKFILETAI